MPTFGESVYRGKLEQGAHDEQEAHGDVEVKGSGVGNTWEVLSVVKGQESHGQKGRRA